MFCWHKSPPTKLQLSSNKRRRFMSRTAKDCCFTNDKVDNTRYCMLFIMLDSIHCFVMQYWWSFFLLCEEVGQLFCYDRQSFIMFCYIKKVIMFITFCYVMINCDAGDHYFPCFLWCRWSWLFLIVCDAGAI